MTDANHKTVAVIVAHPDDETLWAGGLLIDHPGWEVFVACLCRKTDQERAEKFKKAMSFIKASWSMGDMDDGPEQKPLAEKHVRQQILRLLPHKRYDLIVTHSPEGEYTRHRRHEEVGKAVIKLWHSGKIQTTELWTFAYQDGNRMHFPKAITSGTLHTELKAGTWHKKYSMVTGIYGFDADSWEAKTTPKQEAFHRFRKPETALGLPGIHEREIK